jgi:hypothetical protein
VALGRRAIGQRRIRHRKGVHAGPLRQAGVELLPGVVGDVDETEGVNRLERRYNSNYVTAEQSWGS